MMPYNVALRLRMPRSSRQVTRLLLSKNTDHTLGAKGYCTLCPTKERIRPTTEMAQPFDHVFTSIVDSTLPVRAAWSLRASSPCPRLGMVRSGQCRRLMSSQLTFGIWRVPESCDILQPSFLNCMDKKSALAMNSACNVHGGFGLSRS